MSVPILVSTEIHPAVDDSRENREGRDATEPRQRLPQALLADATDINSSLQDRWFYGATYIESTGAAGRSGSRRGDGALESGRTATLTSAENGTSATSQACRLAEAPGRLGRLRCRR